MKLRQFEVLQGRGKSVSAARKPDRADLSSLQQRVRPQGCTAQAPEAGDDENGRLKKLVAHLTLEKLPAARCSPSTLIVPVYRIWLHRRIIACRPTADIRPLP